MQAGYGQQAPWARLLNRVNNRPAPGQDQGDRLPDMVARQRRTVPTPTVSTQRVSMTPFAGGKNVKGRQAWKYPGGNIIRAPTTLINGRYYTDPKEAEAGDATLQGEDAVGSTDGTPRRKQESNFFMTINPNIVWPGRDEVQAGKQFEAALGHLSSNETLARIIKFGPKDDHYRNDKAHDVLLPGIDYKASVEKGEILGRMHAHIIAYIQHYSQIQIDPKMLQYEFRNAFNGAGPLTITKLPYVCIKMLPQSDWTTVMRQYIHKGMGEGAIGSGARARNDPCPTPV